MTLADQVAQCRTPFLVCNDPSGKRIRLDNAAECAPAVAAAPLRFVLGDDLTRLCAALAYSEGARTLACAELLRVPAESVWIEWCNQPLDREIERHGFQVPAVRGGGRSGMLLRASRDGRRGSLRTLWTADLPQGVLASAIEAYFDFDTPQGEEPEPPEGESASTERVRSDPAEGDDLMERCFRFRYQASWQRYYASATLSESERAVLWRHALGTVAIDIPVILSFLLLLGTRSGLPQRMQSFDRLNRARFKAGKRPLLDHIDVSAPIFPGVRWAADEVPGVRQGPRLHHVRGHLVRRGCQLFWRVPHLRGSARLGAVRTRTVTWTIGA